MLRTYAIAASVVVIGMSGCASTSGIDSNGASGTDKPASGAKSASVAVPVPITMDPRHQAGSVLSKRTVYFDYDSYTVKSEYQDVVSAHAKFSGARKDLKVMLEGHADERGSSEYNLALGQKRSEAVSKAMGMAGVSKEALEAVSFGKEKPAVVGHNEAAWSQNRRVDIRYSDDKPIK